MGKSSSPPPAPDPYQVAGAQGTINADTARLQAQLNRPTVNTPFGSQTWTNNGDQYTGNINLAPAQQALFDQQNRIGLNLGGQAEQSLGQPFSLGGAMDTLSSVTEPQYQRDEDALRTNLINSGFRQGSQGYDQALQDFQVNKDKSRAATAQQAFQLASALRTQPLTELNALRTGQQVGMPQFQGGQGIGVNPADITSPFANQYSGQLAGYNANVGSQNAKLGTAGMLGAAAMLSDRRLKSNIKRIGTHPLGIGIYEYDIFGIQDVGVMADEVEEVMPSAVVVVNGYKAVKYGDLRV